MGTLGGLSSQPVASSQPRGFVGKGLDALSQLLRPQSAAFAVATDLLSGEEDVIGALGEGLEELIQFDRKLTFKDVLDAGGLPEFTGRGAIELGGDFILDPLFLVPAGAFGKVIKTGALAGKPGAIGVAGKISSYGIESLQNLGVPGIEPLGRAAKEVTDGLRKWFKGASSKIGLEVVEGQKETARIINRAAHVLQKERFALDHHLRKIAADNHLSLTGQKINVKDVTPEMLQEVRTAANAIAERGPVPESAFNVDLGLVGERLPGGTVLDLETIQRMGSERIHYNPKRALKNISPEAQKALESFARDRKDRFKVLLQTDVDVQAALRHADAKELEKMLTAHSERLSYVPHLINPDAKEYLIKNYTDFGNKGAIWNTDHDSLLQRHLKDVGIYEVNELGLNGQIDLLPKGMPLFVDDPNLLDAVRAYRTIQIATNVKFVDDMVGKYGFKEIPIEKSILGGDKEARSLRAVTDEAVDASGRSMPLQELRQTHSKLRISGYENVWMPNEAAEILNKNWTRYNQPEEYGKVAQYFRGATSLYKLWTLSPFPEYHFRNAIGNINNMRLAGMDNPAVFSEFTGLSSQLQILAGKLNFTSKEFRDILIKGKTGFIRDKILEAEIDSIPGKLGKVANDMAKAFTKHKVTDRTSKITLGKVSQSAEDWLEELDEVGALTGGFFPAELKRADVGLAEPGISQLGEGKFKRGFKKQFFGKRGSFVAQASEVGSAIESNARSSLYLWARSQGKTVLEARDIMNKHLFDYLNPDPLTKFGRETAFPFLTWSRYNVPLQVEYLINDPTKQAAIAKLASSIEAMNSTNQDIPDRYVAEWVRQGMNIRVRRNPDGGYDAFLLNNFIPLADLAEVGIPELTAGMNEFSRTVGDWVINMLNPIIKLPIETATNYSFYYGRKFLPERRRFVGLNMPEPMMNILRASRVLSVMDRFITSPRDKDYGKEIIRTLTGVSLKQIAKPQDLEFNIKAFNAKIKELEQAKARATRFGNDKEAARLQQVIEDFKRRNTNLDVDLPD